LIAELGQHLLCALARAKYLPEVLALDHLLACRVPGRSDWGLCLVCHVSAPSSISQHSSCERFPCARDCHPGQTRVRSFDCCRSRHYAPCPPRRSPPSRPESYGFRLVCGRQEYTPMPQPSPAAPAPPG